MQIKSPLLYRAIGIAGKKRVSFLIKEPTKIEKGELTTLAQKLLTECQLFKVYPKFLIGFVKPFIQGPHGNSA
jgi:hypothetical protein